MSQCLHQVPRIAVALLVLLFLHSTVVRFEAVQRSPPSDDNPILRTSSNSTAVPNNTTSESLPQIAPPGPSKSTPLPIKNQKNLRAESWASYVVNRMQFWSQMGCEPPPGEHHQIWNFSCLCQNECRRAESRHRAFERENTLAWIENGIKNFVSRLVWVSRFELTRLISLPSWIVMKRGAITAL